MKFPELKELPTQELVDRLTAERDALAAQVTQLWRAAVTAHNAHSDFYEGQKFVCNTIMSTPKQCLAEIKAQAVEVVRDHYKNKFPATEKFTAAWIVEGLEQYAKELRQATKEQNQC